MSRDPLISFCYAILILLRAGFPPSPSRLEIPIPPPPLCLRHRLKRPAGLDLAGELPS